MVDLHYMFMHPSRRGSLLRSSMYELATGYLSYNMSMIDPLAPYLYERWTMLQRTREVLSDGYLR
jgi:hypothetical protein